METAERSARRSVERMRDYRRRDSRYQVSVRSLRRRDSCISRGDRWLARGQTHHSALGVTPTYEYN